jgi:spermidine synthase
LDRVSERGPVIVIEDGRKILRVDGVIQSVHVDESYLSDFWDVMLPDEAPSNVLILGLGGGTMAQLLTNRFGLLPIVGVERDPAVIFLARHEFGLALAPHVRIEHEDAFIFARRCAESFDFIAVDLYTAGKMAHGVLGAAFLRDVKRLLTPEGLVTFNLWRSPYLVDQTRRLARVFTIHSTVEVDDNIIVRCGHPVS